MTIAKSDFTYFYLEDGSIDGDIARFSSTETWHMAKVCRVKTGDTISATDGKGTVFTVEMTSVSKSDANGKIVSRVEQKPPNVKCDLALPFVMAQKADLVVEKCTELGVSGFRLFGSEKSISQQISAKRLDRLDRIAISAMKQSMRAHLPEVSICTNLTELAKAFSDYDRVLYGHLSDESKSMREVIDPDDLSGSVLVLVGPEPGFTEAEIDFLSETSAIPVRYGDHRLRTETAAVVLTTLVLET